MNITSADADTGVITFQVDGIGTFTYTVDFADVREMRAYKLAKAMYRLKNDKLADTDIAEVAKWPEFSNRMHRQ